MTPIQELKQDYERRAETAARMIKEIADGQRIWERDLSVRLTTKASLYREFAHELGKLVPEEAMIKALHAQIAETQRLYQTILNIEYRGKASGVELYDCVADEAVAVLDKLHASMEKPKEYQP